MRVSKTAGSSIVSVVFLGSCAAGVAGAQSPPVQVERNTRVVIQGGPGAVGAGAMSWFSAGPGLADFDVLGAPLALEGGVVKGVPYSAEGETEVVQTLADGNRIARKNSSSIARDSAGRTRREQSLTTIGPLVGNLDGVRQIIISDPQEGVTYFLDPATKTARKLVLPKLEVAGGAGAPTMAGGMVAGAVMFQARQAGGAMPVPKTESLGVQTIEGVSAEGTRTTMTIPAGQIGNDRPIDIVSERWYSPELKALVSSRQSDPRFGETTYRLVGLQLDEPPASLFEVPPDYKIVDGPSGGNVMYRFERREDRSR